MEVNWQKKIFSEIATINHTNFTLQDGQYLNVFKELRTINPDQTLQFRLKSGVDVLIPFDVLHHFVDPYSIKDIYKSLSTGFCRKSEENFQSFLLPEKFMKNKTSPSWVHLSKTYGKICTDKFDRNDVVPIKLAFLYPDHKARIRDGYYMITVCEPSLIQNDPLKKLLLGADNTGFNNINIRMNFHYIMFT